MSPRLSATKLAVDGTIWSGVAVARMIRSMSDGVSPASLIAAAAAVVAMLAVVSSVAAMRRSLIPVRSVIH